MQKAEISSLETLLVELGTIWLTIENNHQSNRVSGVRS